MTSILKVDTIQNSAGTTTLDVDKQVNIGKGFSAWPSGGQTFSSGSTTKMNFVNEDYDDFDAYDTSTSTFTVPVTGTYLMSVGFRTNNGANNMRMEVGIYVGSTLKKTLGINQQNTNDGSIQSSIVQKFTAGDAVTIHFNQNSGSTLTLSTQSNVYGSAPAVNGTGHWSMTLLRES